MHKIKIRIPATLTNFGPGLQSIGLALSLYTTIEVSARNDEQLIVETTGEGAGQYAIGLRHPVVRAMTRLFQQVERAPLGIQIRIDNQIPLDSGLGAETAFTVAGVIGANNLLGSGFSREEMLTLATQLTGGADAVSAMMGGLAAGLRHDTGFVYRMLPLTSFRVIVAVPELAERTPPTLPNHTPQADVRHNLNRLPLFLDALRTGDLGLLAQVLDDRIHAPHVVPQITGYAHIAEVARLAGAAAVTTSGNGPAMIFLAETRHDRVSEAIETAFHNLDIKARVWVLPLDTQGVMLSVAQSI